MTPEGRVSDLAAPRALPYALAFIVSFCVMLVELVAGRMLSRHVGASLYSWTSVIGIVLGGISLGNLLGGRLADRVPVRKLLGLLLYVSGSLCLAIPLLDQQVAEWSAWNRVSHTSWPLRVAVQVVAVFFVPATLLGLVGPAVAKWAIEQGDRTGRSVGSVYAWGALGSIAGTFATGFYLIALLGTAGATFAAGAVLLLSGLALSPAAVAPVLVVSWPLVAGCFLTHHFRAHGVYREWSWTRGRPSIQERVAPGRVYTDESQYSFVKVVEERETHAIYLCLDNLVHARYVPGKILRLQYGYEKIYASVTRRFAPGNERLHALFLGGGGYVFPRYVQRLWPRSRIQVAEIDPAVTRACFEAFDLSPNQARICGGVGSSQDGAVETASDDSRAGKDPRPFEIYHLDARNHVEDLVRLQQESVDFEPFDFVYGDAFNDYSVPFHLVTREFTANIRALLRPDTGLYLLNVIDIYACGEFLGSICKTLEAEFPRVYVFATAPNGPDLSPIGRDTFIVVGALRDLDLTDLGKRPGEPPFQGALLGTEHVEILKRRPGAIVLTDDHSPVENLLEEVVRRKAQR